MYWMARDPRVSDLLDVRTVREPGPRLIGNVAIEVRGLHRDHPPSVLAGFENHGGRTYLEDGASRLGGC